MEGATAPEEGENADNKDEHLDQPISFTPHDDNYEQEEYPQKSDIEQILQSGPNRMGCYPVRNRRLNPKYFCTTHYVN